MGIFVGLACRARCDVKSRNIWLPACFVMRKLIHSVIIYYHNVQRWVFWSRETEIVKSHHQIDHARILVYNIIEVEPGKLARSLVFFSTGFLKWNRCYCVHSNAALHVYIVTSSLRVVPRGNINDHWLIIAFTDTKDTSMFLSVLI